MNVKSYFLDLGGSNLDAGAHGAGNGAASDILALCSGRLCLDDGAHESVEVLSELFGAEGSLADGAVDDVGLVETVLDLTGFNFLDGSGDVGGHSASLGRRHEALRAENLTETTDDTHHIRGSNDDIEIKPVFLLDLLNELHAACEVSAGLLGLVEFCVLGEHENLAGLAGAVRENDGTANLLVSMTGINAEFDMNFNSLVELGGSGLYNKIHSSGNFVLRGAVDQFRTVLILFTSKQCNFLLSGDSE